MLDLCNIIIIFTKRRFLRYKLKRFKTRLSNKGIRDGRRSECLPLPTNKLTFVRGLARANIDAVILCKPPFALLPHGGFCRPRNAHLESAEHLRRNENIFTYLSASLARRFLYRLVYKHRKRHRM